jgi:hypothetical protein
LIDTRLIRVNFGAAKRHCPKLNRKFITASVVLAALFPTLCLAQPQTRPLNSGNDACRSIPEPVMQKECYATPKTLGNQTDAQEMMLASGWRLLRIPNRSDGFDTISISHAADFQKSDPNFAGLMVRCADGQLEVVAVVIEPYPPSAEIDLSIKIDDGRTSNNAGIIIPPGVMVRVPSDTAKLITDSRNPPEQLDVRLISRAGTTTKGFVKLAGLEPAMAAIKTLCKPETGRDQIKTQR